VVFRRKNFHFETNIKTDSGEILKIGALPPKDSGQDNIPAELFIKYANQLNV
jgi:hypothetical protein